MANKYRFLASVTVDSTRVVQSSTGALMISVSLINDQSQPATTQTSVRLEIGFHGSLPAGDWSGTVGAPAFTEGVSDGTTASSSAGRKLAT